jgi:hypothetical protein
MGSIALTMLNIAIPSLLKYFILTVSTFIASNLIISFYRKVVELILTGKRNYSGELAMAFQQNNNTTM